MGKFGGNLFLVATVASAVMQAPLIVTLVCGGLAAVGYALGPKSTIQR